ncbi:phosphoglycerate mutase family protein [Streptococcus porcinus]|uniref:histidine phosphatase family protein n=1 Tax=Streptococcus porcinus TaxID=1340 RepID=UPI0010CAB2E2|nr:histidine phosphatase family protein [Streptococcus porcinus]VTS34672.1 phosphoglycerate mutase family protein [Streptococcus porcinus]
MKFYFVRHGKTEWNLEGRFQGGSGDSPLLEESYQEIKALGHYLKSVPFDAIYSSDLKRAQKTAHLLAKAANLDLTIHYNEALREWHLGKLEGAKIATMSAIYPSQMAAFTHNLAKFNSSQFEAESIHQTTSRVKEFIMDFKDKNYQNVLIVGHGANLTASIRSLLGYEPALLRALGGLNNLSLTVLETDDFKTFKCLTWNDKSYL